MDLAFRISIIPDFFELYCGFPHMRRYEGMEKKLVPSDKERKRIRKHKEKLSSFKLVCAHSEVYFTFPTVFSQDSFSVLLYQERGS